MNLPYALQLAYGWTRLNIQFSACAILVFVPALFFTATRYGAVGGAVTWAALNACYIAASPALMHRRYLRGELRTWLVRDIGYPLIAATAVVAMLHPFVGRSIERTAAILEIGGVELVALAAASLAAPQIREAITSWRSRGAFPLGR
jgi:hypothetical protein